MNDVDKACAGQGTWELSVPSFQSYCKPTSALKR